MLKSVAYLSLQRASRKATTNKIFSFLLLVCANRKHIISFCTDYLSFFHQIVFSRGRFRKKAKLALLGVLGIFFTSMTPSEIEFYMEMSFQNFEKFRFHLIRSGRTLPKL